MTFHNTPTKISKRQLTARNITEDVKHQEFPLTADGCVKWYYHLRKLVGNFFKSSTQ